SKSLSVASIVLLERERVTRVDVRLDVVEVGVGDDRGCDADLEDAAVEEAGRVVLSDDELPGAEDLERLRVRVRRPATAVDAHPHLRPVPLQLKWDGTQMRMRIDSGGWSANTNAKTLQIFGTGQLVVGKNYASGFFDGRILEVGIAPSVISDANFDNIKAYVNTRYALAL